MKKYYVILVALLTINTAVSAQNILGVKVDIEELEYKKDSVKIDINFNLEKLNIGVNESVVLSPKMFKGDVRLELPTLVVRRRGGAKSYERATVLDNNKRIEEYNDWYGTSYKIVDYYGAEKQKQVQYSITIPYQSWMIDSELYVDCSTCGCCKSEDSGTIIPVDNSLIIDIPVVEQYNIVPVVELIKPEKIAVKRRDVQYSSTLVFRVNSTDIDPYLEGNSSELESIDKMMQSVISDDDYTITKVNIIGYASPEGRLDANMKLSKGRARALEALMAREYKNISPKLYNVEFGGENWDMLYEIVKQSDIKCRNNILDIIKNVSIEDGRELHLMKLNGGATYQYLLKNIFPSTRQVIIDVEYNIDAYDIDRIAELINSKPQNLSLEEMYRLSETYEFDDAEFEKIFLTAVDIYPDDEVAQNNALVTEIRRGNIASVSQVAERVDKETLSAELANSLGVYYMLSKDYTMAKIILKRAIELGSLRAKENMIQLDKKQENQKRIEDVIRFKAKVDGNE